MFSSSSVPHSAFLKDKYARIMADVISREAVYCPDAHVKDIYSYVQKSRKKQKLPFGLFGSYCVIYALSIINELPVDEARTQVLEANLPGIIVTP